MSRVSGMTQLPALRSTLPEPLDRLGRTHCTNLYPPGDLTHGFQCDWRSRAAASGTWKNVGKTCGVQDIKTRAARRGEQVFCWPDSIQSPVTGGWRARACFLRIPGLHRGDDMAFGGRRHHGRRVHCAAVETLEARELFCVEHALTETALSGSFGPKGALYPDGPARSRYDISLEPVGAAPGQVNGSAIFGGGIYGAAAASYTAARRRAAAAQLQAGRAVHRLPRLRRLGRQRLQRRRELAALQHRRQRRRLQRHRGRPRSPRAGGASRRTCPRSTSTSPPSSRPTSPARPRTGPGASSATT